MVEAVWPTERDKAPDCSLSFPKKKEGRERREEERKKEKRVCNPWGLMKEPQ